MSLMTFMSMLTTHGSCLASRLPRGKFLIALTSPLPRLCSMLCLGLDSASSFLPRPRLDLGISALVFHVPATSAPLERIFSHGRIFILSVVDGSLA